MLTKKMLYEYEKECGAECAINLLLLCPPDQFKGNYDEVMEELQNREQ